MHTGRGAGVPVRLGEGGRAARFGQLALAKELLKRGASVNLPSNLGITPLMGAAAGGHLAVLLFLLEHSAMRFFKVYKLCLKSASIRSWTAP